jgi:hypothetical protein
MPACVTWTAAMDAALRALREQGFNWIDIAHTLGVNPATARRRARELGIPTHVYLSSGTLSGVAIVGGKLPLQKRFAVPSTRRRLGKRWVA